MQRINMQKHADNFLIRPATPDDLSVIVAITEEVFAPFSIDAAIEKLLGQSQAASWIDVKAQDIGRELDENPDACFVAEIDGRVAGYVTNKINKLASRGVIANLAVAADCGGRGIGRKLLQQSIGHFRKLGLKQAKIETLACNPVGQHLYPSVGFKEIARQIHYIMAID